MEPTFVLVETKICKKCGISRSIEDFKLHRNCNECERKYHREWRAKHIDKRRAQARERHRINPAADLINQRKYKYGITQEGFDSLLAKQEYRCAICKKLEGEVLGTFHVDHCHTTQRVRGILCGNCNRGLGIYRDDPSLLREAADYVEGHHATTD